MKALKKGGKKGSALVDDLKASLEKEKKERAKAVKSKQTQIEQLRAELNATRGSVDEKHSVADAAIRQTERTSTMRRSAALSPRYGAFASL